MDISEKVFTKYSNWRRKKKKDQRDQCAAFFEDNLKSVRIFFNLICPYKKILLYKGDGFGSVTSNAIVLPESISFFQNPELNRKTYLHKALFAGVIHKFGIQYCRDWKTKKERSFQVWALHKAIQNEIRRSVACYDDFFGDLLLRFRQGDFQKDRNDMVFEKWLRGLSWDLPVDLEKDNEIQLMTDFKKVSRLHSKRIVYFPMAQLMLSCGLLGSSQDLAGDSGGEARERAPKDIETEIEGKTVSETDLEVVDLDSQKDQDNPIIHSFESLHTADEYQGAYRVSDGADELQSHQRALDELHLETVTRSGDQASSVYRAVINSFLEILDSEKRDARDLPSVFYPEWDFKKGCFKKEHCRLYLGRSSRSGSQEVGQRWLSELQEKYHREIIGWKQRIECLANNEIWINRQWEGPEVDLNNFINYCGDMAIGHAVETPLYTRKKKDIFDTAILLLFDQSFSTDSWVQNRRVLDMELEAIGLAGVLTQRLLPSIAVAGTWSETRNHCHFSLYKDFREDWTKFYGQVQNIKPMGYTRLGPSIRHAVEKLCTVKARRRVLIILTDGKPTDYDRYEGRYGIEDVRNAINRAETSGVHTKALAVEKGNVPHFAQIFGEEGYVVLNDMQKFPEALWEICLESSL